MDVALAEAFRAVAHRLTTATLPQSTPSSHSRFRSCRFMVEAYIYGGDRQSRDIYETLMQD